MGITMTLLNPQEVRVDKADNFFMAVINAYQRTECPGCPFDFRTGGPCHFDQIWLRETNDPPMCEVTADMMEQFGLSLRAAL